MSERKVTTGRRANIFELATMYDGPEKANGKKSHGNVVVNTNRLYYGSDATISAFLATAYDNNGNVIDSIEGYFLEPLTDYELATTEGSDTAIMPGTYSIVPKSSSKQRYKWYISNVDGRSGIAIHSGKSGSNTTGCLIPGENYGTYNSKEGESFGIIGAAPKTDELFRFFDIYGKGGIKINICMPDTTN